MMCKKLMFDGVSGATVYDMQAAELMAKGVFTAAGLTIDHCWRQYAAWGDGDTYGERGLLTWLDAEKAGLDQLRRLGCVVQASAFMREPCAAFECVN